MTSYRGVFNLTTDAGEELMVSFRTRGEDAIIVITGGDFKRDEFGPFTLSLRSFLTNLKITMADCRKALTE